MPLSYASFEPPTGNVAPALQDGTKFNAPFSTTATFSGSCAHGEYRQYVKGTFKVNGSALDHVLCGSVLLQPTEFQEDGCPSESCSAYGHRSCPQHAYDNYSPHRSDGCQFEMYDAPGFSNVRQGKTYSLDLTFEGRLIDVANGDTILVSGQWTTTGSKTVTETPAAVAMVGFDNDDRIVGVHYTRNTESGAAELHVVIVRPAGRPPLDAAALTLEMLDQAGRRARPLQEPSVYEVGNRARATASIVYPLSSGEMRPATVVLSVNGAPLKMKVQLR